MFVVVVVAVEVSRGCEYLLGIRDYMMYNVIVIKKRVRNEEKVFGNGEGSQRNKKSNGTTEKKTNANAEVVRII